MTLHIRDAAGASHVVDGVFFRDADGDLQTIDAIRVRDTGGVSRLIYSTAPDLTLICAPDNVIGGTFGSGTATTDESVATPTGGTAPYTYAWTLISYTAGVPPTIDSPSADTTTFTQTGIGPGDGFFAVFRCTVTDDDSNTATADVGATFYSYDGPL